MDSNARRFEEKMTDCGDQSKYKAFFSFNRNFDESWFYNYVGPNGLGQHNFEYKNFNNSKEFADFCTVYTNQSTSCLPLTELGGAGVNGGKGYDIKLLIRLGTSDTPGQKRFCPKIVMQLIDFNGARRNDGSRRMKAYLGYHKEEYDTVSKGNKNYQNSKVCRNSLGREIGCVLIIQQKIPKIQIYLPCTVDLEKFKFSEFLLDDKNATYFSS